MSLKVRGASSTEAEGIALHEPDSLSGPESPAASTPGPPRWPRCVVLTGFMGAGKTTVGRLLAKRLGYRFVDADEEMELSERATIAQLFAEHGELWFRELEHRTIRRLLETEGLVLALGGGAIEDERTREMLLEPETAKLVHLEASIETVLRRCQGTEAIRPVLRDAVNLNARYERRLPLYRLAHVNVAVDSLSPSAVVQAILDQLSAR